MARILITGMSAAGKSDVLDVLRQHGYLVVDIDGGDWVRPDGDWDGERLDALLRSHRDVFLSGKIENHARFYDKFDDVVLLSAPLEVVLGRLRQRVDECGDASGEQQRQASEYFYTVEPLLRSSATFELDGCAPADDLADVLERLVDDDQCPV